MFSGFTRFRAVPMSVPPLQRRNRRESNGIPIAPLTLTAGAAKLGNPRGPQHATTLAACLLRRKSSQHAESVYAHIRKHVRKHGNTLTRTAPYRVASTLAAPMLSPARLDGLP